MDASRVSQNRDGDSGLLVAAVKHSNTTSHLIAGNTVESYNIAPSNYDDPSIFIQLQTKPV